MAPERVAEIIASRNNLAAAILALRDAQPQDDGTKKAKRAIKNWAFEVAGNECLVAQMDAILNSEAPSKSEAPGVEPMAPMGTVIAAIPKGKRAELRVSVNEWKGRLTVDLRLWFQPKGGGAWGPSRKGVSIDAAKIDALLQTLTLAKQHLVARPVARSAENFG